MKFSFQRFYTAASSRSQRRSKEGGVVAMAAGGGSVGDANLRSYIDGNFVTLATEQTVEAHKNYAKGISMYGIPWEYDVERDAWTIRGNVIITKGLATYSALKEDDVLSVFDGLPIDNDTLQWQETEGGKVLVAVGGGSGGGLDESKLQDYLDEKKYVTESWITGKNYALKSDLDTVSTKLNNFLEGSDTNSIIDKWSELEVFLSGLAETDNLATILSGKANKSTTLAGYGITNAYTKTEVQDNFLALTGGQLSGNLEVYKSPAYIWANNNGANSIGFRAGYDVGVRHRNSSNVERWALAVSNSGSGMWTRFPLAVNMSIDEPRSTYSLYVNGATRIDGQLSTTTSSDRRLKENIRKADVGMYLRSLGGAFAFEYISEEVERDEFYSGTHIGFIYQNIKSSLLSSMCIEREDGYGSLNYLHPDYLGLLGATAINHEDRFAKLEKRVEQLEKE